MVGFFRNSSPKCFGSSGTRLGRNKQDGSSDRREGCLVFLFFSHRASEGSTRKYDNFSSLRTQTVRPFPVFGNPSTTGARKKKGGELHRICTKCLQILSKLIRDFQAQQPTKGQNRRKAPRKAAASGASGKEPPEGPKGHPAKSTALTPMLPFGTQM